MNKSLAFFLSPWLVTICVVLVSLTPCSADGVPVEKIQIAEGIYQFKSADDGYVPNCNSVVIVNQDDVLVFDTFSRASTSRTVLAEIRKITNKPVRYVVNSHHHPDHWSGNEVYAEAFPNVEIIASEDSRHYMLALAKSWPPVWTERIRKAQTDLDKEVSTGKQTDGTPLTADQRRKGEEEVRLQQDWLDELMKVKWTFPTLTYVDQLTLRHGGREFRFMSMTGDASGTTVLYLPEERILITGDTIANPIPGSNTNLPLSQLLKSVQRLAALDADAVIPGHGPAIRDKNFLKQEAELIQSVTEQVNRLVQDGAVTVDEMQKKVDVESFRSKFTHNDKDLNDEFKRSVDGMVDSASREARDGRKWEHLAP